MGQEEGVEQWMPVKHTSGRYLISNRGRIVSNVSGRKKLLVRSIANKYRMCTLRIDGNSVTFRIHRLVALHFVKNPKPKIYNTVNHIDHNTLNNHHKNLEWTTQGGNNKHCWDAGRQSHKGSRHPIAIMTEKMVRQIRKKFVPYVYTHNHLAKEFGLTPACIRSALHQWKHI
jgi:hypothetical protein